MWRCHGCITPAISAHIQGSFYTFAKAAIIAMTKHIACVHGCNNTKAFIARRDIATGAANNSISTDQKMNVLEEPSMKRWGNSGRVSKILARVRSSGFSSASDHAIMIFFGG
jgi:hypothetical protein